MAGEFRVEIEMGNRRYFLRGEECGLLSDALECGGLGERGVCAQFRDDLRKALEHADATAHEENSAPRSGSETLDAEGVNDGDARCTWCGEVGCALPMRPGDAEALYVCRTPGCQREGKPAARTFFTTGFR